MKKLPIGIQTFRDMIGENYLYIDKTKEIAQMLTSGGRYYFISRPRRFGKSLLISTLHEIFSGNKELFKDLWIYDKIEWNTHPVIHIDFTTISYRTPETLKNELAIKVETISEKLGVTLDQRRDYIGKFEDLISGCSKKGKVVILVDEYDKPIIDFVDDPQTAKVNRDILRQFYSIIKASDQYIQFTFLTGVSKFSRVSIFSGLNNLRDITMSHTYASLMGYTEDELVHYFKDLMDESSTTELEEIRTWYNGYSWDGETFVYNPFSILNYFTEKQFKNYWFASGTPTFLVKKIEEHDIMVADFENTEVDDTVFESFDIDSMEVAALLFQTGYLTVKKKIIEDTDTIYSLTYPNKEVRESFLKHLLKGYTGNELTENLKYLRRLKTSVREENPDEFMAVFKSLFASIPSNIFLTKKEAYYHTVIYLILKLSGARFLSEEPTNLGRIDGVLETPKSIYIMEFKMGKGSEKEALKQIKKKKYYQKYQGLGKRIVLMGIGFDEEEKNVSAYTIESLNT